MSNLFFLVERAGIHSTFQDSGHFNLQHLGISVGGVVDDNLYKISNKLLNNNLNEGSIEFAYQGPRLKLISGNAKIAITGNVHFKIERKKIFIKNEEFFPFQTYNLFEGDVLDIIATKKSVYGYLSIQGGFLIKKFNSSISTLTRSSIGGNNGKKITENQKILFLEENKSKINYKSFLINEIKTNIIQVIEGLQIDFFSKKSINKFYNSKFKISNNTDRMGIRLEGYKIINIKTPNISSEGIIKGSIQVSGDGNPIVLMSDHPTIGGYPKIATIVMTDFAKISQLSPGKEILFNKISISDAELKFHSNQKF